MRPASLLSLCLAAGLGLAAFVPAPTALAGNFTKVSASVFKVDGVRYWRKKASEAQLGSVGRKLEPLAGKNYFQVVRNAPDGLFEVHVSDPYTVTTAEAKEFNVTPAVSNGQVTVAGSGGGKSKYSGKVTAYKLNIVLGNSKGDLRYETNRHIPHLQALKDQGGDGRMISAVWILVEGEENQKNCYTGELGVSSGGVSVKVDGKNCSKSTWTIPEGAIMGYEMVKVDDWNNEEIVKKVECPEGFEIDRRKSPLTPADRCVKTTFENVSTQCKLGLLDDKDNWHVDNRPKRDVCVSEKGKDNKDVECSKGGYDYVVQEGRDTCRKAVETFRDASCPNGYDYDKMSTSNDGKDQCQLRGVASFKPDSMDGF